MKIKIYTDGACIGNPGPGGWAAIILENDVKPILQLWFRNPTHKQYDNRDESEKVEQPLNDVGYDDSREPPYIQDENGFV